MKRDNEYLYGYSFFPQSPLSWLAPWWSFACGVLASGAWRWDWASALRGLTGLLLACPLLGTAWAACVQHDWRLQAGEADNSQPEPGDRVLPYTLPDSPQSVLATELGRWMRWWSRVRTRLGTPLVRLLVAGGFSLVIALQIGSTSALLVACGLAMAVSSASSLLARQRQSLSIWMPMLLTWLLGHTTFSALRLNSAVAGWGCAVILVGLSLLDQPDAARNDRLGPPVSLWPAMGYMVLAAILLAAVQPLAAAVVVMLGTLPLVMASARLKGDGPAFFGPIQWSVLATMLAAGLALGYR